MEEVNMKWNWYFEESPWEKAEYEMKNGTVGNVVEICLQELIESNGAEVHSGEMLNDFVEKWELRLKALFGSPINKSVFQRPLAVSCLLEFKEKLIVRLFGDIGRKGVTSSLEFEVIGSKASLIYRTSNGLSNIFVQLPSGDFLGRQINNDYTTADLESICKKSKYGQALKLGVLSLDHPHAEGNHFPALNCLKDCVEIVAIADQDKSRCEKWLKKYGAKYYEERDRLLSDNSIDAVLITSKNSEHATDSMLVANAGKDIFCDKPIAINSREMKSIVDTCQKNNVRFVTTYPLRFHPVIQALKKSISRGEFGDIQAIMATNHGCTYEPGTPAWVKDPRENGGGCIIDHTVHVADVIRYLTNEEFINVHTFAHSVLKGIKAEDIAVCHGEMTGNIIYQIDCSWSRKASDPPWGDVTMRIIGTDGFASLDLYNNHKIEVFTSKGVEYRYPFSLIHQHGMIFMDYLKEKSTGVRGINADDMDGLKTMELVFSSYESVKTKNIVTIKRII
jgi:predicted dehydrogenase